MQTEWTLEQQHQCVKAIVAGTQPAQDLALDDLATLCDTLNAAYRRGEPWVTDAQYDQYFHGILRARQPDHPFLQRVEPEATWAQANTLPHEVPLLSTEKAYTPDDMQRFFQRVATAADTLGISAPVQYRVTPKLDGIAGYWRTDGRLVTRGDGLAGSDVSFIFDRGVPQPLEVSPGPGEIVCRQSYFLAELEALGFRHPRNFIAGFVGADTLKNHHHQALAAGALLFMPYTTLPTWTGTATEFMAQWQTLYDDLRAQVDCLTDGIVLEALDPQIRTSMGATQHHHRWQLAIKAQGERAQVRVEGIRMQTGRTGRVTPILEITPVILSGAEIRNVTAHTVANLAERGLGIGAIIEIVRSGDVIPKLVQVITPATAPLTVDQCPACATPLNVEGEYRVCPNRLGCSAQVESRLRYFFATLGNNDLFGPRTITRLVNAGHTHLLDWYALTVEDFASMGFGSKHSSNLVQQLQRSRQEPIADWRFLAALGIRHLGPGDSQRLLAVYPLDTLGTVTAAQIEQIEGFGPKTSTVIVQELQQQWPTMTALRALGFRLTTTPTSVPDASPLAGESVVFTGKLVSGTRAQLEAQARQLGATVLTTVTQKTTLLVCGEKAGSKLIQAEAINQKAAQPVIRILNEAQYQAWIRSQPT